MEIKAHITNIEWDTSDEEYDFSDVELPTEFDIEVDVDDDLIEELGGIDTIEPEDIEEYLNDAISDEYGFCMYHYDCELIKEN